MDFGTSVTVAIIFCACVLGVRFFSSSVPGVSRKATESFAKNLPEGFGYPYYLDNSGYGINAAERKIFLQADGKSKTYDRSNIREIEWILQGASKVYGTPPMAMKNRKLKKEAYNSSGLFISTADIDTPMWHIKGNNEQELRRSFEILQQFLNGELIDYQEYLAQRA